MSFPVRRWSATRLNQPVKLQPKTAKPASPGAMLALLVVSAVCAAVYLPAYFHGWLRLALAVELICPITLLAYAERPTTPRLLPAALAFSALGDMSLGLLGIIPVPPGYLFITAIVAFTVAQLCFMRLFAVHTDRLHRGAFRRFVMVLTGVLYFLVLAFLWPSLGKMQWPVALYAAVLALTTITAQRSQFPDSVALGTLLLALSDVVFGIAHFHAVFFGASVLIWGGYYVAQLCITVGVVQWGEAQPREQVPSIEAQL